MGIIFVDIFCALLIVGGIVLAIRGAGLAHGPARLPGRPGEAPRPAAYAMRIAGEVPVPHVKPQALAWARGEQERPTHDPTALR
mgnify:CR=1 FL=1